MFAGFISEWSLYRFGTRSSKQNFITKIDHYLTIGNDKLFYTKIILLHSQNWFAVIEKRSQLKHDFSMSEGIEIILEYLCR